MILPTIIAALETLRAGADRVLASYRAGEVG